MSTSPCPSAGFPVFKALTLILLGLAPFYPTAGSTATNPWLLCLMLGAWLADGISRAGPEAGAATYVRALVGFHTLPFYLIMGGGVILLDVPAPASKPLPTPFSGLAASQPVTQRRSGITSASEASGQTPTFSGPVQRNFPQPPSLPASTARTASPTTQGPAGTPRPMVSAPLNVPPGPPRIQSSPLSAPLGIATPSAANPGRPGPVNAAPAPPAAAPAK